MKKTKLLITAGPTIEKIDPVRIITNRSTGLMGYEIARAALKRKYLVRLITGPTNLGVIRKAKTIFVETALQMQREVKKEFKKCDCLVMAAAVSDYRIQNLYKDKIKKGKTLTLKLKSNPDILKSLGKSHKKTIVGFALESKNILKNAKRKLLDKNLDILIANKIDKKNIPFGQGKKNYIILSRTKKPIYLRNITKERLARAILDSIKNIMI